MSPIFRLAALALTLATSAPHTQAAEWTQLPGPASSVVAVYTDVASERSRHGRVLGYLLPNPRQAWFITDYATPHRWKLYQIASSKQLIEFDCKRSTMRVLNRLYYDGAMAQGRLLASETPAAEFTQVVPGDIEEAMQQSACRPPPPPEDRQTAQAAAATAGPTAPADRLGTAPADATLLPADGHAPALAPPPAQATAPAPAPAAP